jgi:hypothetical protein
VVGTPRIPGERLNEAIDDDCLEFTQTATKAGLPLVVLDQQGRNY